MVVRDNVITNGGLDGILADSLFDPTGRVVLGGNLQSSLIAGNITSGNVGHGIVLRQGNSGNTISGNVSDGNARTGIYAERATGNLFEGNSMHGNGTANPAGLAPTYFDARDDSLRDGALQNTWIANLCGTDFPTGTICGIG